MNATVAGMFFFTTLALTPQQAAEIRHVETRLLAPCCYRQPVYQHMSDAAEQMREDITAMVAAGQDEHEIIGHYKSIYGERILVVPDGKTGKTLFAFPPALCLLSVFPIVLLFRRLLSATPAASERRFPELPPDRYEIIRRQIESATRDLDE